MTKEQILDVIKLLSALEGWIFTENRRMPDHLLEGLEKSVETLSAELLK